VTMGERMRGGTDRIKRYKTSPVQPETFNQRQSKKEKARERSGRGKDRPLK